MKRKARKTSCEHTSVDFTQSDYYHTEATTINFLWQMLYSNAVMTSLSLMLHIQ